MSHKVRLGDWHQSRWDHCGGHDSSFSIQKVEGRASLLGRQDFDVYVVLLHEANDAPRERWSDFLIARSDHQHIDLWLEYAEEAQRLLVDIFDVVDVPRHYRSKINLLKLFKINDLAHRSLPRKNRHRSNDHHSVAQSESHLTEGVYQETDFGFLVENGNFCLSIAVISRCSGV